VGQFSVAVCPPGGSILEYQNQRFAIHTTRKRLIGVQRELQKNGKDFRAFEILNLGKYERQFFMDDLSNGARKSKEEIYVNLILEAYKAKRIEGHFNLHGSKAGRFVHVGPLDVPVTQSRLQDIFEECRQKLYTQVDVLGFEFEMGLTPQFIQELREKGVSVTLKYIPKEVFDKRAVEKGQARFYDVAYLNANIEKKGKTITVELTDFVTHYTQDDIEELQQSMRAGSKVVIEDGQIFKLEKDKNGVINRTLLTENWHDWIDYWAIDFNMKTRKKILSAIVVLIVLAFVASFFSLAVFSGTSKKQKEQDEIDEKQQDVEALLEQIVEQVEEKGQNLLILCYL